MRITDKKRRILLGDKPDESLFQPELDYYRSNNQYHVDLFNTHIINIYKRINVQIVLTKVCNFNCLFCIEKDGNSTIYRTQRSFLAEFVKEILTQYKEQGIVPTISITGGEPTLAPTKLHEILDIIFPFTEGENGIKYVNVNSNGTHLHNLNSYPWVNLNISRHHYDFNKNEQIFGNYFNTIGGDHLEKSTLQCVLMKGYIDSVSAIKIYMGIYSQAKGFSFRGLSILDDKKDYFLQQSFTSSRFIDIKHILDQVANDKDFEFIQQKIGDHYIYEIYKYKGKTVRFVYSNFSWLRQVETEERKQGQIFSRATIIDDNNVYSGWAYDINRVYERA